MLDNLIFLLSLQGYKFLFEIFRFCGERSRFSCVCCATTEDTGRKSGFCEPWFSPARRLCLSWTFLAWCFSFPLFPSVRLILESTRVDFFCCFSALQQWWWSSAVVASWAYETILIVWTVFLLESGRTDNCPSDKGHMTWTDPFILFLHWTEKKGRVWNWPFLKVLLTEEKNPFIDLLIL